MAQFDVHRNPGRKARGIPYFVVVQSSRYGGPTVVVVPLLVDEDAAGVSERLFPVFEIEGRRVRLDPLQIVAAPRTALGDRVTSLVDHGDAVIDAVDLMLTRAYG